MKSRQREPGRAAWTIKPELNARGQIQSLKQRINIYLDATIVEHFKKKAGSRGYQTLINEELKHSMHRESMEQTVRKVVRDELKKHAA